MGGFPARELKKTELKTKLNNEGRCGIIGGEREGGGSRRREMASRKYIVPSGSAWHISSLLAVGWILTTAAGGDNDVAHHRVFSTLVKYICCAKGHRGKDCKPEEIEKFIF